MELTKEQGAALKAKHGRVYVVSHNDRTFVIRPLTRAEHIAVQSKILGEAAASAPDTVLNPEQAVRMEDEVVRTVVVWPEDQKELELEAGTIPAIFQRVLEISGFSAATEPVEL